MRSEIRSGKRVSFYYGQGAKPTKYKNTKCEYDGIVFDSIKEKHRYQELKLLERVGEIKDLQLQKVYELVPAQYETVESGEFYKVGFKKGQPKTKRVCVEKAVTYKADFVYTTKEGKEVVEDTKSEVTKTTEYIIKRKLMLYIHGIKIKEI